jgi:hypothetical protein
MQAYASVCKDKQAYARLLKKFFSKRGGPGGDTCGRFGGGFGLAMNGGGVNGNWQTYERTNYLPKTTDCAESGTGNVLVVRVRAVKEPAVLRRVARRNGD